MKVNKNGISLKLLKDVRRGLDRLRVKQLGAGVLYHSFNRKCCALGAAAIARLSSHPLTYEDAADYRITIYNELGADKIVEENDNIMDLNELPEDRYKRMSAWVDKQLADV